MERVEALICADCRFAEQGPSRNLVWCPVLKRNTEAQSQCQVSREGVLKETRLNESQRDEIADINRRLDDLYELQTRLSDQEWEAFSADDFAKAQTITERERQVSRTIRELEGQSAELQEEVSWWVDVLRYLWSRTTAPSRKCPRCDFTPVDSAMDVCPVDHVPLSVVRSN